MIAGSATRTRVWLLAVLTAVAVRVAESGPEAKVALVAASTAGQFAEGYSWQLRVTGSGQAELTIATWPVEVRRSFRVPPAKLAELVRIAQRERFDSLASEYGQHVPDGSTTTLTVDIGDGPKTVRLHYLMNWVYSDPARLQEPARALRLFQFVRSWFSDPEAVDLRRYDDMVLEAASGRTRR